MATKFPPIPDPKTPFEKAVKEILEIFLALRGIKNSDGKYLDRVILFREFVSLLSNNIDVITAIATGLSEATILNDPVERTIFSGIISVTGSGMVTLSSESGVTDILNKISGLVKGQSVYLVAATGHTITITAGAYLKLPSPTWILSNYRIATFDCLGGDICVMRSHEANIA
jgi:hypothetical protein